MRLLFIFLLLFATTWARPFPAAAQTLPLAIGEWAPYNSAALPGYGFATEIVTTAMEEAGLTPTYTFLPWLRGEAETAQGRHFGTFPYYKTPERDSFFLYSDPILTTTISLFYKKSRLPQFQFTSLNSLKKYKIGGVRGYYYKEPFKKAGLDVVYTTSTKQGLQQLAHDWVDLFAEGTITGWHLIKQSFPDSYTEYTHASTPILSSQQVVMISKQWPNAQQLLEHFNKGLASIKRNGEYDRILKRHGVLHLIQSTPTSPTPNTSLW